MGANGHSFLMELDEGFGAPATTVSQPTPWIERWPNQTTDGYDPGLVRDGHKLLRHEHPDDGIEVIHPDGCAHENLWDGQTVRSYDCPWESNLEWQSAPELFETGTEGFASELLPVEQEIEVLWQFSSGRNHWGEHETEFFWKLPEGDARP